MRTKLSSISEAPQRQEWERTGVNRTSQFTKTFSLPLPRQISLLKRTFLTPQLALNPNNLTGAQETYLKFENC